jgi:GTP-binding protein LepA
MKYDQSKIRNFSIIAHIDHGKSTLADRILELTETIEKRDMKEQILDSMDLERERGITIKLNAVTVSYKADDGQEYIFNLIDTPGHVDFTYEVSRSLAACEGALLLVDATQGVEAQTLANTYLAVDNDLTIIPVINKIDLKSAMVDMCRREITERIGLDGSKAIPISAKTGENVRAVLERVVSDILAPSGSNSSPLKALIFDSFYDSYRGVVVLIRVKDGCVKLGDKIHVMRANKDYVVTELGIRTPKDVKADALYCGEVGYLCAQIKDIKDIHVGDTITLTDNQAAEPLKGYKKINPMVYCGIYPTDSRKYEDLKVALEKLSLNDASFVYEAENSKALGFGFRCGFLGLLHMDVVQERLEREYNLDLILTAPSVVYKVYKTDGEVIDLANPCDLPDPSEISRIEEPFVRAEMMTPKEFVGDVMQLCKDRRGIYKDLQYFDDTRMVLIYEMPLSEIVYNFFDRLKSCTKGYASLDYELSEYKPGNLAKLDIMLNGEVIDALSSIVYKPFAYSRSLKLVEKLKDVIPRQQFEIPVQALIGGKIIARADIKALRKDVLAKCYGGDITRKKKLLEKQKEGKKRMKSIGYIDVPQEAFMSLLSIDDEKKK